MPTTRARRCSTASKTTRRPAVSVLRSYYNAATIRRLGAALLLVLLLAPLAEAHVEGARPVMQTLQRERTPEVRLEGLVAVVDLHQNIDPLRDTVRHTLDPARGRFGVEHRPFASAGDEAFRTTWELTRLVEYRDLNADGRFQPGSDTAVKAWRLQNYRWNVTPVQDASVGGIAAKTIIWEGNLSGAPSLRVEAAIAGREFADEGATARPQDVMLYVDVRNLPPRSAGSLYALEGTVFHTPGAVPSEAVAQGNITTGALVDSDARRALLIWGGEALLDGREQRILATVEAQPAADAAEPTAALRIHMPITDKTMHFVIVSGVEYELRTERAPGAGAGILLLVVAAVALVARTRRA